MSWLLRGENGEVIRVGKAPLTLGRDSCQVTRSNTNVSRKHVEVLDCAGLLTVHTLSKCKATHICKGTQWTSLASGATDYVQDGDAIGLSIGDNNVPVRHFTVVKDTAAVQAAEDASPPQPTPPPAAEDESPPPAKQPRLSSDVPGCSNIPVKYCRAPGKPACPYGRSCYRKNPRHFEDEDHPADHPLIAASVAQVSSPLPMLPPSPANLPGGVLQIESPVARLLGELGEPASSQLLKQWAHDAEVHLASIGALLAKTSRENGVLAIDFGWHATRGMDRNAAVNGIAYSYGGTAARQLVLRDFDDGRQHAAMSHAEAARKDRVEHLVPRRFAADSPDKHPSTCALLRSEIILAAAKLTSDMLRVYKPALYARGFTQVSNPDAPRQHAQMLVCPYPTLAHAQLLVTLTSTWRPQLHRDESSRSQPPHLTGFSLDDRSACSVTSWRVGHSSPRRREHAADGWVGLPRAPSYSRRWPPSIWHVAPLLTAVSCNRPLTGLT